MTWWKGSKKREPYYVCPECGFKQKSQAKKRVTCHRCGRSYRVTKAKTATKTPDQEKGKGFFKYTQEGNKK